MRLRIRVLTSYPNTTYTTFLNPFELRVLDQVFKIFDGRHPPLSSPLYMRGIVFRNENAFIRDPMALPQLVEILIYSPYSFLTLTRLWDKRMYHNPKRRGTSLLATNFFISGILLQINIEIVGILLQVACQGKNGCSS